MTTDITKLKRKRTSKRNDILNITLVEVSAWLDDEENDSDDKELELRARLDALVEGSRVIKKLDEDIFDLITDEEAEEDDKNASAFHIKVSTAIKRLNCISERNNEEK